MNRFSILKSSISLPYSSRITEIINSLFTSLPTDYISNGTWSFSNNGANITGTGGLDSWIYWNKYTALDRAEVKVTVQINDINSVFRVFRKYSLRGTLLEIDCANNLIKFYEPWNGDTTLPAVEYQASIPFNFVSGRDYDIYLTRKESHNYGSIVDTVTTEKIEIDHDFDDPNPDPFVGSFWGYPGFSFASGDITVKNLTYTALFPKNPRVLIIGDSFIEAYTLQPTTDSLTNSISRKVYDKLNGNCVIAGKGGDKIGDMVIRADVDLDSFSPQYVLVCAGLNDSNYTTWLNGKNALRDKIIARGATPIWFTLPPRAGIQDFLNQANDHILTQTEDDYIDLAAAFTQNGDRVTQDPIYYDSEDGFVRDDVHYNPTGGQRGFEQIETDTPYIF